MLAALALLNEACALLARNDRERGACRSVAALVESAAACIGSNGMIGGQIVDLELQGAEQGADSLASRNLKTTALMRLTMTAGAIACGAEDKDVAALAGFGESLGMAYQICDDLLDELAASDLTGKPARQDSRHCRPTHVAELGIETARQMAADLIEDANRAFRRRFGKTPEVELLGDAANAILRGAGQLIAIAA